MKQIKLSQITNKLLIQLCISEVYLEDYVEEELNRLSPEVELSNGLTYGEGTLLKALDPDYFNECIKDYIANHTASGEWLEIEGDYYWRNNLLDSLKENGIIMVED